MENLLPDTSESREKGLQPMTFRFSFVKVHLTFLPACSQKGQLHMPASPISQFSLAMTKGQFIQIRRIFYYVHN